LSCHNKAGGSVDLDNTSAGTSIIQRNQSGDIILVATYKLLECAVYDEHSIIINNKITLRVFGRDDIWGIMKFFEKQMERQLRAGIL
jgi:hypothetical protein